jgi:type 1 glutamine amidotransferase
MRALLLLAACATLACAHVAPAGRASAQAPRVLVFSKTAAFRHGSIPAGVAAVKKLGAENGFDVDATEDAAQFTAENLRRYRAVVFLSTTGDVLNAEQQAAFEGYIRGGGGWVGVHAATDTEYDWPWYGRLAGAYFDSHPRVQKATFVTVSKEHPSTDFLPDRFEHTDEFYDFKSMNPGVRVLLRIDESTYQGGKNGANHPMAWYHAYDGGRAFYTAVGHTDASFAEPLVLRHLLGGIRWAMGGR